MKLIRKTVSLLLAAVLAVTSLMCCGITASAATSMYDMVRGLKKHPVTAKTTLDSSISYSYEFKKSGFNITISGLNKKYSEKLDSIASDGGILSVSLGTNANFNVIFEEDFDSYDDDLKVINFKRPGLDEEYVIPDMSFRYFTPSGSGYKLSFRIEMSKWDSRTQSTIRYTYLENPIKSLLDEASAATLSLSAVSGSGKRTYYAGKQYIYIPYEKEKSGKISVKKLKLGVPKSKEYNGSKITFDVTLKNGTYRLIKDTDYTLSFSNNVKVGKATVTIKGKGDYTGTRKATFTILPKRPAFSDAYLRNGKVILRWAPVENIQYYYIYRSGDGGKSFSLIKTLKAGTTTFTTNAPTRGTYIFKIRASTSVGGKTYYSKFSDVTRGFRAQ